MPISILGEICGRGNNMNLEFSKKGFLTSNMLKVIAMVTMLVDHLGVYLFDDYVTMRIIGRLAMPIFAFLIAEGCTYTKNRLRHFFEIFLLGVFCQSFMFAYGETKLNILLTFSVSILLIYLTDIAMENRWLIPLPIILVGSLYILVNKILYPMGIAFDYGFFGIILPLAAFVPKNKWLKLISFALVLALLCRVSGRLQLYSLLALIPLCFYNGERGKFRFKYAFYIFYPLHILVILAIKHFMGM